MTRRFTSEMFKFNTTKFERDLILITQSLILDEFFVKKDLKALSIDISSEFDLSAIDFFKHISFFNICENGKNVQVESNV